MYPSKSQHEKLWKHANKLNSLYNYFLQQRITEYTQNKKKITKSEQQHELTVLKQNDSEIKQIHSQVLQEVTNRLDKSYKSFFNRVKKGRNKKTGKQDGFGFPKFRSCRKFFGILYPQAAGFKIIDDNFKTGAYGKIKFIKHLDIKGQVKTAYITCKDNKWYLSIVTDYIKPINKTGKEIGIDLGVRDIVVTSEGKKFSNCSHPKYFDKQIENLQSLRDGKCKKGSRRFRYLSKVIGKLYDAKSRKIRDFQHKLSKQLSREFDTIYVEDLNVKRMTESKKTGLNKSMRNSCLNQFVGYLGYKTNCVKVNPYNTSRTCNNCGKVHNIDLSVRIIFCTCGNIFDRDINAAKNVYCLGQAICHWIRTNGICIDMNINFLWKPFISGSLYL